ncbi:MAG: cobalt-precorrin-5B (C(1))-methyltransferase [Fimbriimonadaceae bacterium]|nr:cobalt-precorrin-5B (C(1))-methyltransferase [Alphaproteobacteria bacterium]
MTKTGTKTNSALRRGWTTGACATAAAKAAYQALLCGEFSDPVEITLPKGEQPSFALALEETGEGWARAGIIKDAGDDPDVTHGAMVIATVRRAAEGSGIVFKAGPGVGTVTKEGLPVGVGQPAINPVPRKMMRQVILELTDKFGGSGDVEIEISVPGGAELAKRTWNPRLGILGGISILGTTGIVHPFSCSAWIHSIHSGIDVARAQGLTHVAGATGSGSEAAVQKFHDLPDDALIDMGDFVGGMLKHLRHHPVKRVTVAGGFAKMAKLAQGHRDLHSGRSQVSFDWLRDRVNEIGATQDFCLWVPTANTANEVLEKGRRIGLDLGDLIAKHALQAAQKITANDDIKIDILVVDRTGGIIGHAG